MKVIEKAEFKRAAKKLHDNQRTDLENAVAEIVSNIKVGKSKVGDLHGIKVHKFRMVGQMTLIAYTYEDEVLTLTLLAFGSHENFYRDLKR